MKVFENIKYANWLEEFNFDTCKLNRKEYGNFIIDYLISEEDGFVLNLNGSWGSGKTEFLKRLYSECINRNHPVIYIDAWESDFSKDPLTVVSCELTQQIELINKNLITNDNLQKLNELLGRSFKAGLMGLAAYMSKKIYDEASVGSEFVQKFFEEKPEDLVKRLRSNYEERAESIKKIREQLTYLADDLNKTYNTNLPVLVFVDELDRCRPTYAVEMLETIKHFFKTKNFVFVIATDTDQLIHSIKSIYGIGFNSNQYLKRFFDRTAKLPSPDLNTYLSAKKLAPTVPENKVLLFPLIDDKLSLKNQIIYTSLLFDLKIRDIDQLINKLNACLRHAESAYNKTNKLQVINVTALLIGIAEFDCEVNSYNSRADKYFVACDKNKNITIEKSFEFKEMADLCIKSTIMEYNTSSQQHEYIRSRSIPEPKQGDPHSKILCLELMSNIMTDVYNKRAINSQSKIKYWVWSDYKRVIELAGNIE